MAILAAIAALLSTIIVSLFVWGYYVPDHTGIFVLGLIMYLFASMLGYHAIWKYPSA